MNFPRICKVCGKEYMALRRTSIYCSGTCRTKAFYIRKFGEPFKPLPGENQERVQSKVSNEIASLDDDEQSSKLDDWNSDMPVEPLFIRRFMRFDGALVRKKDIMKLSDDLFEANKAGMYTVKDEKYGEKIKHIHNRLHSLSNKENIWPYEFKLTKKDREILGNDVSDYLF